MSKDTPRLSGSNTIFVYKDDEGYTNLNSDVTINARTTLTITSDTKYSIRSGDQDDELLVIEAIASEGTVTFSRVSGELNIGGDSFSISVSSAGNDELKPDSDTFTIHVVAGNPPNGVVSYAMAGPGLPLVDGRTVFRPIHLDLPDSDQDFEGSPGVFVSLRSTSAEPYRQLRIESLRGPLCLEGRRVICLPNTGAQSNKTSTVILYRTNIMSVDCAERPNLLNGIYLVYDSDDGSWKGSGSVYDFKITRSNATWDLNYREKTTQNTASYIGICSTTSAVPINTVPPSEWGLGVCINGDAVFSYGGAIYDYKGGQAVDHYEWIYDEVQQVWVKGNVIGTHSVEYYQPRSVYVQRYPKWGEYGKSPGISAAPVVSLDKDSGRFVLGSYTESIPYIEDSKHGQPVTSISVSKLQYITGCAVLAAGAHERDYVLAVVRNSDGKGVNAGYGPDISNVGIAFPGFNSDMYLAAGHGYIRKHRELLNYSNWAGESTVTGTIKLTVKVTEYIRFKSSYTYIDNNLSWTAGILWGSNSAYTDYTKVSYTSYDVSNASFPICRASDGYVPTSFSAVLPSCTKGIDVQISSAYSNRPHKRKLPVTDGAVIIDEYHNQKLKDSYTKKFSSTMNRCGLGTFYTVTGPEIRSVSTTWSTGADTKMYAVPEVSYYPVHSEDFPSSSTVIINASDRTLYGVSSDSDNSYTSSSWDLSCSVTFPKTSYLNANDCWGLVPSIIPTGGNNIQAASYTHVKQNDLAIYLRSVHISDTRDLEEGYVNQTLSIDKYFTEYISDVGMEYIIGSNSNDIFAITDGLPNNAVAQFTRTIISGTFDKDPDDIPVYSCSGSKYIGSDSLPSCYILKGYYKNYKQVEDAIARWESMSMSIGNIGNITDMEIMKYGTRVITVDKTFTIPSGYVIGVSTPKLSGYVLNASNLYPRFVNQMLNRPYRTTVEYIWGTAK